MNPCRDDKPIRQEDERPLLRHRVLVLLATLLGAIVVDLATKEMAVAALQRYRPVAVVGEWIRLTLGYNEGVAFGLFATDGPGVLILSGLAMVVLAMWTVHVLRDAAGPRWSALALGLILGGGTANFIDRLADGRVTDFLDVSLGLHRWPTFNLADVYIVTGVGLILLGSYCQYPKANRSRPGNA